jgi:hypothetical protein
MEGMKLGLRVFFARQKTKYFFLWKDPPLDKKMVDAYVQK